jgi:hypothetical protein
VLNYREKGSPNSNRPHKFLSLSLSTSNSPHRKPSKNSRDRDTIASMEHTLYRPGKVDRRLFQE